MTQMLEIAIRFFEENEWAYVREGEEPTLAVVPEPLAEPAADEVLAVVAGTGAPVEGIPMPKAQPGEPEPEAVEVAQATAVGPTEPAPTEVVQPVSLRLQSIIFNPQNPSAVINRRTVMTGDTVEGYRVREISMTQVTLVQGEESRVLTLP